LVLLDTSPTISGLSFLISKTLAVIDPPTRADRMNTTTALPGLGAATAVPAGSSFMCLMVPQPAARTASATMRNNRAVESIRDI
jgi:fucose permease